MKTILADARLVAACGLYCGACGKYLAEKCPGCRENAKATWCKTRSCVQAAGYETCADCREFADARACGKFHNIISKFFGLIFNSNRPADIDFIRKQGRAAYAADMTTIRRMSLPRR